MPGQRKNGLLDASRDEMHRHTCRLQRTDRFFGTGDQRGSIQLAKLGYAPVRRFDDVETFSVNLVERDFAIHRRVGKVRDLRVAAGQFVDTFDRYQCGIDVEEYEPE